MSTIVIREATAEQLTYTPFDMTRNRKPLEHPAPFSKSTRLQEIPDRSRTSIQEGKGLSSDELWDVLEQSET